jgi:DNA modification methylase
MTAIKREERIGDQRLILGDCLEVMRELGPVDAVVTDPPYGLAFPYLSYDDTPENLAQIIDGLATHLRTAKRAIVTPGVTNIHKYPEPKWIGAWTWETTNAYGAIGFNQWQPVLFYGEDIPGFASVNGVLKSDRFHFPGGGFPTPHGAIAKKHVCPKPPDVMLRLIARFSCEGEAILDPFMGSGTTLVACQKLGRQGIGIEIDPDYFEIACKRVDEVARQPDLFVEPAPKPVQEGFDL